MVDSQGSPGYSSRWLNLFLQYIAHCFDGLVVLRVGDQAGGDRTPLTAPRLLSTRIDPTLSGPVSLSSLQT